MGGRTPLVNHRSWFAPVGYTHLGSSHLPFARVPGCRVVQQYIERLSGGKYCQFCAYQLCDFLAVLGCHPKAKGKDLVALAIQKMSSK
jgi:hypothetical protein